MNGIVKVLKKMHPRLAFVINVPIIEFNPSKFLNARRVALEMFAKSDTL